ncbi:HAD family hydrolase [Microbacterium faecale]|uniref:HAD family hydrolase n=1 Tax=Microbacterium faecale TaxID=1804630 RepID=UPI001E5E86AB|nr:HAD family hydrolase [Microbacterium faecale]
MTSTIVFDFDGTVAVGAGPVVAYAREVARHADEAFLARVEATIRAFDAGETDRFRDGYDIVGTLAEESGIDPEARQRAYLASRGLLGTPDAAAELAPGLAEILADLPRETRVVLATNAPAAGVEPALTAWGVRDRFDELIYDTGKPAGLAPIIERALADGPVLAIGDIVENDLSPATAVGADTALVGATAATSTAEVTMRAETLADLADQIVAWARAAQQTPFTTPSER